jgi:hypothetical protein
MCTPVWRCPFLCGECYPLKSRTRTTLVEHFAYVHNVDIDGKPLDTDGVRNDYRVQLAIEELIHLAPAISALTLEFAKNRVAVCWQTHTQHDWPQLAEGEVT